MINFVNLTIGARLLLRSDRCSNQFSNQFYLEAECGNYLYIPDCEHKEYVDNILKKMRDTGYIQDRELIYQLYKFSLKNKVVYKKAGIKREGFECYLFSRKWDRVASRRYKSFYKDEICMTESGTIYSIDNEFAGIIFSIFAPGSFILKMETFFKDYRDEFGNIDDLESYRKENAYHPLEILDYIRVRSLQDKLEININEAVKNNNQNAIEIEEDGWKL